MTVHCTCFSALIFIACNVHAILELTANACTVNAKHTVFPLCKFIAGFPPEKLLGPVASIF
uniref:Secreted protein n=1 Tax=Anguilla anguilla TaxID=7936 RepID=A0A0E9RXY8_ANGAN